MEQSNFLQRIRIETAAVRDEFGALLEKKIATASIFIVSGLLGPVGGRDRRSRLV